jgi:hypothetical protein
VHCDLFQAEQKCTPSRGSKSILEAREGANADVRGKWLTGEYKANMLATQAYSETVDPGGKLLLADGTLPVEDAWPMGQVGSLGYWRCDRLCLWKTGNL